MRIHLSPILFVLILLFCQCKEKPGPETVYQTDTLEIRQLTSNSFLHISYLNTTNWGKVPCNGLVYINENEALVFDTPTNNDVSTELIDWVSEYADAKVKGVVINHFHVDCLGGLEAFHESGINSYANQKTITLATADSTSIPKQGFKESLELKVGQHKVICSFFGEGHTEDNIVAYFPEDNLLFGGCLLKSDGAGKGNLNDANVDEWSNTVAKIKTTYPDLKTVVPGHGKPGGPELLDYTIQMFRK